MSRLEFMIRALIGGTIAGGAILALLAAGPVFGQTQVQPGFNLFSVEQDVEIGKASAIQVEKQLPMLSDATASRYVSALGAKLAAHAPGANYTYQFKVANLSEVNAFALPGGFIYVNRGLLSKVRTEGELAGVMAHEIAHVALRHPTNQASKAYLANAGIGILGGLLGPKTETTTGQIIGTVGGFGLNALFLKYSRGAETQADIVGAQIMAASGYDPMEMVHFFGVLRDAAGGDPSKFAQFLSDHPAPVDREARVRQEAALLGAVHSTPSDGSLLAVQSSLGRLAPAPTMAQLAGQTAADASPSNSSNAATKPVAVANPSANVRTFRQSDGFYQVQYPNNWSAHASSGYGVTIAPTGGFVSTSAGRQSLVCGFVVNHYVPFDGAVGARYRDPLGSLFGATPLQEASSDLIRGIMAANPYLKRVAGSERNQEVSGRPSFSVMLSGLSPVTGAAERVSVLTRQLADAHVVYMLLVAPAKDYSRLKASGDRMARSLKVSSSVVHK